MNDPHPTPGVPVGRARAAFLSRSATCPILRFRGQDAHRHFAELAFPEVPVGWGPVARSEGMRPTLPRDPLARAALLAGAAVLFGSILLWFWRPWAAPPRVDPPAPEVVAEDPDVPEAEFAYLAAPVVYDLTAVIQDLEEAVPRSFGDLEDREQHPDHDRVEVAYRAEREPFQAQIRGDTALISTVLSYGGRAWYDPPLLPTVSAGCGENDEEGRPRATVELSSRLHLDADWVLRSEARVDTVEALSEEDRDRCRVTPLGIDVTGTALGGVRSALAGRTDEIDRRVAEVDVRSRLQDVWHTLQEPIELTDDVWLLVNPIGVTQGRTHGEGSVLTIDVGMSAQPAIVLGPAPDTVLTDLPPLEQGEVPSRARIVLEGRIHYPQAGEILTRQLQEREVELGRRLIRIQELALRGIGDGRVALEVRFEGSARGRVFLVGRPELDSSAGELHVPDLEFDLETRNVLVGGLAWLAEDRLVEFLRQRARVSVAEVMEPARDQLLRGMNRDLSDDVSVEGDVHSTDLLEVRALRDYLLVHAEADAHATFRVQQDE